MHVYRKYWIFKGIAFDKGFIYVPCLSQSRFTRKFVTRVRYTQILIPWNVSANSGCSFQLPFWLTKKNEKKGLKICYNNRSEPMQNYLVIKFHKVSMQIFCISMVFEEYQMIFVTLLHLKSQSWHLQLIGIKQ